MKIWLFSFINSGGKLCRIENIMTNQWIDEQALVRTLMKTIETYEAAGDPRMRYQAESRICLLVDRLGASTIPRVYGAEGSYQPGIEIFGEYRIPHLEKYE